MIIYKVTNKLNGKCYIGQTTKELLFRWKGHTTKSSGASALRNVIQKYGKDNFTVEEIARYTTIRELNDAEEYFIDYYNCLAPNGYNLTTGGLNKLASPELKVKMSLAQKGNKNKLGVKLSEEAKNNISKAKKGIKLSPAHKASLTSPFLKGHTPWNKGKEMPRGKDCASYGRTFKHTPEAIERIRVASLNMWKTRKQGSI